MFKYIHTQHRTDLLVLKSSENSSFDQFSDPNLEGGSAVLEVLESAPLCSHLHAFMVRCPYLCIFMYIYVIIYVYVSTFMYIYVYIYVYLCIFMLFFIGEGILSTRLAYLDRGAFPS